MTERDLTAETDDDLVTEWHRLAVREQTLGVRSDVAAVEHELLRRCWYAPCAEEPKQ